MVDWVQPYRDGKLELHARSQDKDLIERRDDILVVADAAQWVVQNEYAARAEYTLITNRGCIYPYKVDLTEITLREFTSGLDSVASLSFVLVFSNDSDASHFKLTWA